MEAPRFMHPDKVLHLLLLASNAGYRCDLASSNVLCVSQALQDGGLLGELADAPVSVSGEGAVSTRLHVAALHPGSLVRVSALLRAGADPCGCPDQLPPTGAGSSLVRHRHPDHALVNNVMLQGSYSRSLLHRLVECVEMQQPAARTAVPVAMALLAGGMTLGSCPEELARILIHAARRVQHWAPLFHVVLDPSSEHWAPLVHPAITSIRAPTTCTFLVASAFSQARGVLQPGGPTESAAALHVLRRYVAVGGIVHTAASPADDPALECFRQLWQHRDSGRVFSDVLDALLTALPPQHVHHVWPAHPARRAVDEGLLLAAARSGQPAALAALLAHGARGDGGALVHALNRVYTTWGRVAAQGPTALTLLDLAGAGGDATAAAESSEGASATAREMQRILRAAGAVDARE